MNDVKTKFITSEQLPLVIEPNDPSISQEDFFRILTEKNDYFKQNLLKYGGLLFRNFPIHNEDDFAGVIRHLKTGEFKDYIGGDSPRKKIRDGIYTSTEAPPWVKIPLHNELSFVKNFPTHIYFYCNLPSEEGGETILGDARKIYQSMNPEVRNRFIEKKLRYVSCYYHNNPFMEFLNKYMKFHKPWIDVFETENKSEVEKKCRENEFGFKWTKDNWLQLSQTRPAVLSHPQTNEMVWFNQAHLYDFSPRLIGWWKYLALSIFYAREHTRLHQIFFADNSQISRDDLYHVLDVLDKNTIYFPWQKGDVLVLDNVLAMHGRATFKGKRRILAAMTG